MLYNLYQAIISNDLDFFYKTNINKELIETSCDIEYSDFSAKNATALHVATYYQRGTIIDYFIKQGADTNRPVYLTQKKNNFGGMTNFINVLPLSLAILRYDEEQYNALVSGKVLSNEWEYLNIFWKMINKCTNINHNEKIVVGKNPENKEKFVFEKVSLLHIAIAYNNMKVIKRLIENKHDINAHGSRIKKIIGSTKNKSFELENFTALNLAIAEKNKTITEHLIDSGAHLNDICTYKEIDNDGIAQITFEKMSSLHLSILKGMIDCSNLLINEYAEIDTQCTIIKKKEDGIEKTENITPLHLAAQMKLKSVAHTIIGFYADINAKDSNGLTPKDYAKKSDWDDEFNSLNANNFITESKAFDPKEISVSKNIKVDEPVSKFVSESEKENTLKKNKTIQNPLTIALNNLSSNLKSLKEKLFLLQKKLSSVKDLLK